MVRISEISLRSGSVFESTGYGIGQALQGTLASFANPSSTGELFAGAALIELLAGLSGTFAFAGLFDLGLQPRFLRGVGLPYFVAAVSYRMTNQAFLQPISDKPSLDTLRYSCH